MEKKKFGTDPAFPNRPVVNPHTGEVDWDHMYSDPSMGMSRRLYIATKMLPHVLVGYKNIDNFIESSVKKAYVIADELLKQENK